MVNNEIIQLIKLHDKRKKYLAKAFNVTLKSIQTDTDAFVTYLKSLGKSTISKEEIISFAENNPDTFYHKFFNWEESVEYRLIQCGMIIADKSVVFSSNNEMAIISVE